MSSVNCVVVSFIAFLFGGIFGATADRACADNKPLVKVVYRDHVDEEGAEPMFYPWDHPEGADEISQEIISLDQVFVVRAQDKISKSIEVRRLGETETIRLPADYEGIVYKTHGKLRWEWVGKKLLVRYVDGLPNPLYSGKHETMHLPLAADPSWAGKPLSACLNAKDHGKVLNDYKAMPGE